MGKHLSVDHFRARPDCIEFSDGVMASGSAVLTKPSGGFSPEDTGKTFVVVGALGALANPLLASGTYLSPTTMTLSVSATTSVSGASGAYGSNNTASINAALANCRVRNHGSLLIPSGMYLVGGATLDVLSDIDIYGMGRSSVIYAADYANSAFYANGRARVSFRNLSFKSHAYTRSTRSETVAIWARNCDQVTLEGISIDGSASAGAIIEGCRTVHVRGCEAQNTRADGYHVPGASEKVVVQGVIGDNTGDDTVSVVCYSASSQGTTVLISGVVSRNSNARGVTCIGGRRVNITQCDIFSPGAHGIAVAYESAFSTHTPRQVKISNCRIEDVKAAPGFNALLIQGDSSHRLDDVTIQDVTVYDSNQALIEYADHVRVSGLDIREGPYNGLLVKNCQHFTVRDSSFSDLDESALALDAVTHFEVTGCRAHEVQRVGNGSTGQFHIVNSTNGIGWNNFSYKTNAGSTYGPILVSSCTNVKVGVSRINPSAGVNDRFGGLVHDSATGQVFLNTSRPVNDLLYDLVCQFGAYFHAGPVQIEGDYALLGSGGAAWLKLFGGFAQLSSPSSVQIDINSDSTGTGETLTVYAELTRRLLALTLSGDLFTRGGVLPSNAASGHGLFAITGATPNGVIAAPVGSYCFRDWGALSSSGTDASLYYKAAGGTGNTGWEPVSLANEIPAVSGNGRKSLRVNNGATGYGWTKVPIDDPGAVELPSISASRYVFHSTGGQLVGKGPADIWADIEAIVNSNAQLGSAAQVTGLNARLDAMDTAIAGKADIGHGHSGTTGGASAGTAHTHGVTL